MRQSSGIDPTGPGLPDLILLIWLGVLGALARDLLFYFSISRPAPAAASQSRPARWAGRSRVAASRPARARTRRDRRTRRGSARAPATNRAARAARTRAAAC